MRHRKKSKRFSRSRAQKKALIKSLLRSVVLAERITTTTEKAKYLKSRLERLITLAKGNSLHHRRLAYQVLEDHKLVQRLFEVIAPRFKNINGGYSRTFRLGFRKGDGASLSVFELTQLTKLKATKLKGKTEDQAKDLEKEKKVTVKKEKKPKKGIIPNVRKIFKKEHD